MEAKTYWQLVGLVSGVFTMFLIVAWISFRAGQDTMTPHIDVRSPVHVDGAQIKVEVPQQDLPEVKVTVPTPEVTIHNAVPQQPAPIVNVHVAQVEEEKAPSIEDMETPEPLPR